MKKEKFSNLLFFKSVSLCKRNKIGVLSFCVQISRNAFTVHAPVCPTIKAQQQNNVYKYRCVYDKCRGPNGKGYHETIVLNANSLKTPLPNTFDLIYCL